MVNDAFDRIDLELWHAFRTDSLRLEYSYDRHGSEGRCEHAAVIRIDLGDGRHR